MRTVELPQLKQRRDTLVQQKERFVASLNATIGAINLLDSLIEEETAAEQAEAASSQKD